jgi:peptidoglycan-associated lipoprotein
MFQKFFIVIVTGFLAFSFGCASKKHVRQEVTRIDKEMETIESSVEQNQVRLKEHDSKIAEHDTKIADLSRETQEAMERAQSAEKLAQGKLLYEITLKDEDVRFKSNQSELADNAKTILGNLIAQLKEENKNVYIEVQGHTDAQGSPDYNMKLGQQRAETVRRFLAENGIPLHRISTISYGETRPIADNKTKAGRSTNRRVVIVVLE